MKILIVSELAGKCEVVSVNFIPRVGDLIDRFYTPYPKVSQVIALPSDELIKASGATCTDIDAIIILE